ncbi:MAG: hypothetical protein ACLQJR_09290 [Stellaceae bacterium]
MIQVKADRRGAAKIYFMTRAYTTSSLTGQDVGIAFPLIHAALPDIDLAAWRGFARALVDLPSPYPAGAIGLRNEAGYLCGVLTYRIDRDLRHGTALTVDIFAALDVTGEAAAMNALLLAAEAKAQELRCAVARIQIEGPEGARAQHLTASGYRQQASMFCKPLAPPPPPS